MEEDKNIILVIDDEKNLCELIKMNLEAISEFRVEFANSGKAGISIARKLKPVLIILDILMPGMGGHEVLERLKSDSSTMTIPVVMLSAVSDIESKIKAAKLLDEDYITKPINVSDLKAKIDEILKRRGII